MNNVPGSQPPFTWDVANAFNELQIHKEQIKNLEAFAKEKEETIVNLKSQIWKLRRIKVESVEELKANTKAALDLANTRFNELQALKEKFCELKNKHDHSNTSYEVLTNLSANRLNMIKILLAKIDKLQAKKNKKNEKRKRSCT